VISIAPAPPAPAAEPAPPSELAPFDLPAPELRQREQAQALTARATDAMLQGQLGSALTLFRQAAAADRDNAAAWRGQGLVLQQLGRKDAATKAYREFLRLEPDGPQANAIRERLRALESETP
jgi:Tfp pilus assembly protein PilF